MPGKPRSANASHDRPTGSPRKAGPTPNTQHPTPTRPARARPTPARAEAGRAEPRAGYFSIGRVLGIWGIHGALKLEPLTDFPERFDVGATLWLDDVQYRIERSHWHRSNVIVNLKGLDDPVAAGRFRGRLIELPESELHPLAEDEYYEHDLIGLWVQTAAGEALGRIASILQTGANPVLVVPGAAGEYLLPLIADVVQSVDLAAGRVVVELLPGLEPAPARSPSPPTSGAS